MPAKFRCDCGRDYLCEDCAWEAYSGGVPQGLVNISSGEDVCLSEDGNYSCHTKESNELLQLPYDKAKKSRGDSIVIVKPIRDNEVLHEE